MQWGRIHVNQWVKAITGHNNLAEHQARLDYEIDPQCRLCHENPENTIHLLENCPLTLDIRMNILQNQCILPDFTWDPQALLKALNTEPIHELFNYNKDFTKKELIFLDELSSDPTDSE